MSHSKRVKKDNRRIRSQSDFQSLAFRILQLANRVILRSDFQQEVCQRILDFSGADEVELWLKDHGKYFRSVVKRDLSNNLIFGIRSSSQNESGEIISEPEDDPDLIHLCNNVLLNQTESSRLMLSKSDHHPSLLLIPLSVNQKRIGLLHLKSNLKNYFKKAEIKLYEGLARSLEIAAAHRDAQIDLRERVKELTCL